ncbi:MAG: enoyl-CoA hydratase/isomerase family protein [Acidimicrobiia bacterium]|nr:enoyl-CoA hydratase/isomerase family protein [Acidimicrobiia bacterium]
MTSVREERNGQVLRLVLDQPESRNSLTPQLADELEEHFAAISRSREIAVVVLAAEGSVFCAGGDLVSVMSADGADPEMDFDVIRRFNQLISRIRQLDQPVIAAVNGPAVGGGAALALACDLAVAGESARFDFSFSRVGLSAADMGCSYLLQKAIGTQRAARILLSGDSVSAEEGRDLGLFCQVVPDEELGAATTSLGEKIAASPRWATASTKLSLHMAESTTFSTLIDYEGYVQTAHFASTEHKGRLGAFLDHRKEAP